MAAYGAELELTPREKRHERRDRARRGARRADPTARGCRSSSRTRPTSRSTATRPPQEILARLPRGPRLPHHRRRHRRPHHRVSARCSRSSSRSCKIFAVEPDEVAGDHRRHARPAQAAGHRRRLHPANLHTEHARRRDPGDRGGRLRLRACARRARRASSSAPSSGASLAAVAKKLPEMPDGSRVLTFCYDTGERYLSVEGLFDSDGTRVQVGARP